MKRAGWGAGVAVAVGWEVVGWVGETAERVAGSLGAERQVASLGP